MAKGTRQRRDSMLRVEELAVFRGDHCLFRKVGFAVAPGEGLQVTGPNGSGKTTLLRVLAGFLAPERGSIRWGDSPPADWPATSRSLVAYSGHLGGLKPELTASENLAFFADLAGAPRAIVAPALARAGLATAAELPAAQLSAGQRRRLGLARLGLSTAAVWLLDEPQTNLDDGGKGYLRDLVEGHLAKGGVAVIASHEPSALASVAAGRLALAGA
jgi:heme exporter protein A